VATARLGTPNSTQALEAVIDEPGPVTVQTVVGAEWQVDRSGLLNLKHPKARAAGLVDGPEPIKIFFHVIQHPTRGTFLVDTGVEDALEHDPEHAALSGIVAKAAHVELMKVHASTGAWLKAHGETLNGVFLTHLHLDHVAGMPDVPSSVPLYVGPGEASERGAMNLLTQPIIDRALGAHGSLQTWQFSRDPSGVFAGVLDVFGDGTLWALHVPGHTPGSVAFVARTPNGPVLLTGDACHTAWGWKNRVEPGTFSDDPPASVESLNQLEELAARHPKLDVRLGHQSL
jgi:glyoxylase-like metal-dependent hydrolase (beta-lactamase superfamily II)